MSSSTTTWLDIKFGFILDIIILISFHEEEGGVSPKSYRAISFQWTDIMISYDIAEVKILTTTPNIIFPASIQSGS